MILPTELLKTLVEEVIGAERSNLATVKFTLLNHEKPDFKLDELTLDRITVIQDFSGNITDDIHATLTLPAKHLIDLVKYQSGLYASIVLEYIDNENGDVILSEPPKIFTYKVFIHELANIAKKYGINMIKSTELDATLEESQALAFLTINLQLITDSAYSVNKSGFNGMLNDVTVEDAIKYIASSMGVKKLSMTPSDNTAAYQHFHVPPEYWEFNTIFEFIQKYYGVYNAGLNYYFTDDTLYIYPPFDMTIERSPNLTIFKVAPNSYVGSPNYHDVDKEGDFKIVSNTESVHHTLSNVGAENDGNSHLFIRSDKMIDGQTSGTKLNDIAATTTNPRENSIHPGAAIPKYKQPSMNVFDRISKLKESNTELIVLGWNYARLFLLPPGIPLTYIFDDEKVVMSKKGLVEAVNYSLARTMTKGSSIVYTTTASMVVRLDIDEEEYNV